MNNFFASLAASRFSKPDLAAPVPTCCPYCPNSTCCHWTKHASYERFGVGSERIDVPRWWCKIVCRSFSLLPDALLPYQQRTTATILACLADGLLAEHGATATARTFSIPLITVRRIRSKFRKAVKILRLPGHAGALDPAAFLRSLFALGLDAIAELLAKWKQLEPKHSLVGMHPR